MTSMDVKRPIQAHLDMALRKLDAAIDDLLPADERAQRALEAEPVYLYGALVGQLQLVFERIASLFTAGFESTYRGGPHA